MKDTFKDFCELIQVLSKTLFLFKDFPGFEKLNKEFQDFQLSRTCNNYGHATMDKYTYNTVTLKCEETEADECVAENKLRVELLCRPNHQSADQHRLQPMNQTE